MIRCSRLWLVCSFSNDPYLVEIMEFVSSQKWKQKIIINGFIYFLQKDLANKVRLYECELRRNGQCKAKIKLDLGDSVIA